LPLAFVPGLCYYCLTGRYTHSENIEQKELYTMPNYWTTPTHAGAATPYQLARRAAARLAAVLITAATLATFAAITIIFN
jgi:hypothetical protein